MRPTTKQRRLLTLALTAGLLARTAPPARADVWREEPPVDMTNVGGTIVGDEPRHRVLDLLPFADPFGAEVRDHSVFAMAYGETSRWIPVTTEGTAPPLGVPYVVADDAKRDRLVLLGDFDAGTPGLEAWALDLAGVPRWERITPSGVAPSARVQSSVAYDPIEDRVLLFGGALVGNTLTNETWALRFNPNLEWVPMQPAGTEPPPLGAAPATFDATNDRLVVIEAAPNPIGGNPRPARAWILSLSGAPAWDVQVPGGPQPPEGALGTNAARDSTRNLLLVLDPRSEACGLVPCTPDFWGLALAPTLFWVQYGPIADRKPSGTTSGTLVIEQARGRPWVVSPGSAMRFNLDAADVHWNRISVIGGVSNAEIRAPLAAAYDAQRNRLFAMHNDDFEQTYVLERTGDRWGWATLGALSLNPAGNPSTFGSEYPALVWDPLDHRLLRIGGEISGAPAATEVFALDPDARAPWQLVTYPGTAPSKRSNAAVAYDPVRHRVLVYGGYLASSSGNRPALGDLYSLDLVPSPHWTQLASAPTARAGASFTYDPVGNRFLLADGASGTVFPKLFSDSAAYAYSPVSDAWQLLPGGGAPPGGRWLHEAAYDTRRQRLIVQGGDRYPAPFPDTHALRPALSPPWIALATTGPAPSESSVGAFYDSTADEFVVAGSASYPQSNLRILAFDVVPSIVADAAPPVAGAPASRVTVSAHVTNDARQPLRCAYTVTGARDWPGLPRAGILSVPVAVGARLPIDVDVPDSAVAGVQQLTFTFTALDGVSAADTCVAEIDVTDLPRPSLACGGDVTWIAGARVPVDYTLINDSPAAGPIAYRLTGDRAWPGLPLTGEVDLPGGGAVPLALAVPVPDTAAVGAVLLHLVVAPKAVPSATTECYRHLHDASTPALLSIVEAAPEAGGGAVKLTWFAETAALATIAIERRTVGGDWLALGTTTGDADGRVVFEDRTVAPGTRYAYRAGIVTAAGTTWSTEFWIDVPAAALAFAARGASIVHGAFDVAFTLPHAGGARLEAYDVRGRLVAARSVDAAGAGRASARLAEAGALRPGIYFLRLTQGAARVQARALVLGAQ